MRWPYRLDSGEVGGVHSFTARLFEHRGVGVEAGNRDQGTGIRKAGTKGTGTEGPKEQRSEGAGCL